MNHTVPPSSAIGSEWTSRRVGSCATRLFLYCFMAYACSYIGRKNFSACLPAMIGEGFLTKTTAGYITTAYMIVYGAGQMLNGIIATKIKPRYMISTGLLGAGLCNLTMGCLPSSALMPVIWALNGLFHSMLWAPIIRTFTDLLPAERKASAGTNISASCSIGAVLAFLIPGIVLKLANWRVVFYISAGILLTAFLIWTLGNRFLADYIRMMEEITCTERAFLLQKTETQTTSNCRKSKHSLPAIILVSGLWVVFLPLVCNGALRDAVESWAPTFLSDQFSLDGSTAAIISVVIPIVSVTGTYVANWLYAKKFHNELLTACVMFAAATACVGGLFLCRELNALLCAVFMAISISAMWGGNHMFLTVVPYHFAPMNMSAAVTGLLNGIIYFATALCSTLYGMLADRLDWDFLVLIWFCLGIVGTFICLIFAKLWSKRRRDLDEGHI